MTLVLGNAHLSLLLAILLSIYTGILKNCFSQPLCCFVLTGTYQLQ